MIVKLDACSLIYLTKVGLLDLVEELYGQMFITEAVYREAVVGGKNAGYGDALTIEQHINTGKIKVVSLAAETQERLVGLGVSRKLAQGEKETIIEAMEERCLAILDDLDSRTVAAFLGVPLCGSDTVLIEALLKKLISHQDYTKKMSQLAIIMGMRADDLAELLRLGRLIEEAMRRE